MDFLTSDGVFGSKSNSNQLFSAHIANLSCSRILCLTGAGGVNSMRHLFRGLVVNPKTSGWAVQTQAL